MFRIIYIEDNSMCVLQPRHFTWLCNLGNASVALITFYVFDILDLCVEIYVFSEVVNIDET